MFFVQRNAVDFSPKTVWKMSHCFFFSAGQWTQHAEVALQLFGFQGKRKRRRLARLSRHADHICMTFFFFILKEIVKFNSTSEDTLLESFWRKKVGKISKNGQTVEWKVTVQHFGCIIKSYISVFLTYIHKICIFRKLLVVEKTFGQHCRSPGSDFLSTSDIPCDRLQASHFLQGSANASLVCRWCRSLITEVRRLCWFVCAHVH